MSVRGESDDGLEVRAAFGGKYVFDAQTRQYVLNNKQGDGYLTGEQGERFVAERASALIARNHKRGRMAMDDAAKDLEAAKSRLLDLADDLQQSLDEIERRLKQKTGRVKDHTVQAAAAMSVLEKQMRELHAADISKHLTVLVDAMSRLDELEKSGRLEAMLKAMRAV